MRLKFLGAFACLGMQAREKRLRAAKLPYAVCPSSPASFTLNVHGAYLYYFAGCCRLCPPALDVRRAGAKQRLFHFTFSHLYTSSALTLSSYLPFSLFFPPPPHTPPHTHKQTHHTYKKNNKQTTTYTALSNYLCVLRIDIFSPPARPILYTYNDGAHARAFG